MGAFGRIRIGISGWRYAGWRGVFYPAKLSQRRELEFAAGHFPSVEINGTFYSLQRPTHFQQWMAATPENFVFAVKGSRYITHMLKLRNIEQPLANLLASGLLELGPRFGPMLWQFAPQMRFDAERFAAFFNLLPRTQGAAASMARLHDERLKDRASLALQGGAAPETPIRHCVEIRHESFATPAFIELLRRLDIGLVVADTVAWPLLLDVTADFVYVRLHGSEQLYTSGYSQDALDVWADRVVAWAAGRNAPETQTASHAPAFASPQPRLISPDPPELRPRDVYVYFDNDAKVHAPFDAQTLQRKVAERLSSV